MIKKFSYIKNLAVFNDFNWDSNVVNKDGRPSNFTKLNILYGRNYSGKTTLSRILRAIELGEISEKYDNPEFEVLFNDGSKVTLSNLESCMHQIRVFNKDFIQDNLSFITNPEEGIKSFSVGLGADNKKIMEEIQELESKLGDDNENNPTGLYLGLKGASEHYSNKDNAIKQDEKALQKLLSNKATDKDTGIKYSSDIFGDQNYSISKLSKDIVLVLAPEYIKLDKQEKEVLMKLIKEERKSFIPDFNTCRFTIFSFYERAKELVSREIGVSDKIQELLNDIALSEWVKKGYEIHKSKKNICGFCGSMINDERWKILDKHFSQETQLLEQDIKNLMDEIDVHKKEVGIGLTSVKSDFYVNYGNEYDKIMLDYDKEINIYISLLSTIYNQLGKRYQEITKPFQLDQLKGNIPEIERIITRYKDLIKKSNDYTNRISQEQQQAKVELRLLEVFEFLELIDYKEKKDEINLGKEQLDELGLELEKKWSNIRDTKTEIERLKRELVSEEQGALKVNEYLETYFENSYLSLRANEVEDEYENYIEFEIWRKEGKAYHLSEGECSLIAFCYFMAKLHDVDTVGKKPIIWIDDPISSLDGNHIFCIYSIIAGEILYKDNYNQIFISTHNLDFLRYLKRANGQFVKADNNVNKEHFIIERIDEESIIKLMPKYMKNNITEFNYLFEQIYRCACIENIDDSNYSVFYNFGNNARKFLELYLYYRYPCSYDENKKMELYFGKGKVPVIFMNRINNEYSHMKACFERGQITIDVPEMRDAAITIINKLKEDEEQFRAFMESIGEEAS